MISKEAVATIIASTKIGGTSIEEISSLADALLDALHRAGYVIVPKKPTLGVIQDADALATVMASVTLAREMLSASGRT